MSRKDLQCLGSQRPSLSANPLLIAPELGKSRKRCFSLPSPDFTYGMRTICFDGGVAEAVSIWHAAKGSMATQNQTPEKDFIALNKMAAQNGLTTAQEQSQFRACHDIRRRDKDRDSQLAKSRYPPEGMTFGVSTRPSTPLFELLENRYGEKWLTERREAEKRQRDKIKEQSLCGKVFETNASLLRRHSAPVDPPPLWKMKRFSKIPASLNTFYSDKERSRAFNYHMSDSIGRKGTIGQGIYTT